MNKPPKLVIFLSIIIIFTATNINYAMESAAGPAEAPTTQAPAVEAIAQSFKNIENLHQQPITVDSPIQQNLHRLGQEFLTLEQRITAYHAQTTQYRDVLNQAHIVIGHIQRHLEEAKKATALGDMSAYEHAQRAHKQTESLFGSLSHFIPCPEKGLTRPIREYARAITTYPQENRSTTRLDAYAGLASRLLSFGREIKERVSGDVRCVRTEFGAISSADDLVSLERMAQDYTSATRQVEPESRTASGASSPQESLLPESLKDAAKILEKKGKPAIQKVQAEVLDHIDLERQQPGSLKETVVQALRPPIGPTTAALTAPIVRSIVPDAVIGWFIGNAPAEHRQRKIETCKNALGDLGRAYLFANRAWQTYTGEEGVEKTIKQASHYVDKVTQALPRATAYAQAAPSYVASVENHIEIMDALSTSAKTTDDDILQTLHVWGREYGRHIASLRISRPIPAPISQVSRLQTFLEGLAATLTKKDQNAGK